ncbi:MAG: DUF1587 domain-containing protein [Ignavibacteriota bacterium]
MTAKRLNRNEYRNTIRDLLGVDFRADQDFPTDDSGYGFDNIADILTVSPLLMEKYLNAAETIASRAMGADPLPKKPIEITSDLKTKTLRRLDYSTVEASQRLDFDGEYNVIFGFPGQRGMDAKPVQMAFYMDGQLLKTMDVETKPSGLVYFNPFSDGQMRLYLPEGDHVFRAQFLNDDFVSQFTTDKAAYDDKKNKFIGSITFVGPFPSKVEKQSRKTILICDPATGTGMHRKDCDQSGAPCLSPSSDESRGGGLAEVRRTGEIAGPDNRAGNSNSRWRRCWYRPNFCSASNAIPTQPTRRRRIRSPIRNSPRA